MTRSAWTRSPGEDSLTQPLPKPTKVTPTFSDRLDFPLDSLDGPTLFLEERKRLFRVGGGGRGSMCVCGGAQYSH